MADPQFEEFRTSFESLPQHIKATPQCYQIVHGIDVPANCNSSSLSFVEGEGKNTLKSSDCCDLPTESPLSTAISSGVPRKRRKLPQIPIDKEPLSRFRKWPRLFSVPLEVGNGSQRSYFPDKKNEYFNGNVYLEIEASGAHIKPYLRVKTNLQCSHEGSPEDFHDRLCNDIDSGHSSSHTPDGIKPFSPAFNEMVSCSSSSTISSIPSTSALQLQEATHRGLYKFLPRHSDEIEVDIGDPVYVHKEADDFWCEGTNLKTGLSGIFPSAYVTDVEYSDFDPEGLNVKKERYILDFLGSLEVSSHKGNKVLLQAVRKIVKSEEFKNREQHHPCILEISDNGLRMVDRYTKSDNVPSCDFFFNLKNVTFCGYHPHNHRYFGFVTKHPLKQKFACHIFMGQSSTRDVAEAIGRAFQRFYQKFVETMYPVEDIYIE